MHIRTCAKKKHGDFGIRTYVPTYFVIQYMQGAKWRHTGFSWFSFCLSDPCLGFAGRLRTENMLFGKCPRGRLRPNRTREGVPRTAAYFLFGLSCWRGHSPNRIPEASRRRSPNSSIFSVRAQLLERALPEQDPRSDPRSTKCRPVRPRTRSQGVMQKSTCEKRFFMVLVLSLGPLPRFR